MEYVLNQRLTFKTDIPLLSYNDIRELLVELIKTIKKGLTVNLIWCSKGMTRERKKLTDIIKIKKRGILIYQSRTMRGFLKYLT